MLLRYIVSNFKSIGHPITFSMLPVHGNTEERFLKTIHTKAGDWNILRRGGFCVPNASGKTSFIESLEFAKQFIVDGKKTGKNTGINQFRGNWMTSTIFQRSSFYFTKMVMCMTMAFPSTAIKYTRNG